MKSRIAKRSVNLLGHKTSVSLEEAFWVALKEIADERGLKLSVLVEQVDNKRELGNLSSTLRQFVLEFYRNRTSN